MNLQLFIDNEEVELNSNVSFPLNKSYEDLTDPTNIIVDYSKSINIPMSAKNNRILGNAYRLDRVITGSDSDYIGLYLDPTKRIPFRLMYNGDLLIEGYCKFLESNISANNGYYTLTLYGVLGDIFQKLKSVVLTADQLTDEQKAEEDGGAKYILDDGLEDNNAKVELSTVASSFAMVYNECIDYDNNPYADQSTRWKNTLGFAPAHRGLYEEFDSAKVQTSGNNITDISISGLDIGDGLSESNMQQYRYYEQRPFVFFNQLLYMFKKKISELSEYSLELDPTWFNGHNPYWAHMCYMLDYMRDNAGEDVAIPFSKTSHKQNLSQKTPEATAVTYTMESDSSISNPSIAMSDYKLDTINLSFKGVAHRSDFPYVPSQYLRFMAFKDMGINPQGSLAIKLVVSTGSWYESKFYWASTGAMTNAAQPYWDGEVFNADNFLNIKTSSNITEDTAECIASVDIPKTLMDVGGYGSIGTVIEIETRWFVYRQSPGSVPQSRFITRWGQPSSMYMTAQAGDGMFYMNASVNRRGNVLNENYCIPVLNNNEFTVTTSPINILLNWKSNTPWRLSSFYKSDNPAIFNVILQYTKMYNLIWDVDYKTKKITLSTRKRYFENNTVTNWDDRVDKSKDLIVKPVSFDTKFVNFNYEDIDGYHFTDYKDKYGVNYGAKKMATSYNFNSDSKDLFEEIYPSCCSARMVYDYYTNTFKQEPINLMDCDDEDQKSISTEHNWYFRVPKYVNEDFYYVTADSSFQESQGTYCYYNNKPSGYMPNTHCIRVTRMGEFTIASRFNDISFLEGQYYGSTFNTPNIDYTRDESVKKASNRCIYDLFWKEYIDERYNIQNKVVTGYFRIKPADFINFRFNNFVTLGNQLFMVNKIVDYDISSTGLTKCELVQVTDINKYAAGIEQFRPWTVQLMNVPGETFDDRIEYTGTGQVDEWFEVRVYSNPMVREASITQTPGEETYGMVYQPDIQSYSEGYTKIYISFTHLIGETWTGKMTVGNGENTFDIPLTIHGGGD